MSNQGLKMAFQSELPFALHSQSKSGSHVPQTIAKTYGSPDERIYDSPEPQTVAFPNLDKLEISHSELSTPVDKCSTCDTLLSVATKEDLLISEAIKDLDSGNSTPIRSTSSSPANLPKKGRHNDLKRCSDGRATSHTESDSDSANTCSASPSLPQLTAEPSPPENTSLPCDPSPEVEAVPNVSLLDTLQKLINLRKTLLNSTSVNTGPAISQASPTTLQKKKHTGKSSSRKSRAMR